MKPDDLKRALLLYKRYKTDGFEFRRIAEMYGLTTVELTARCYKAMRMRQSKGRQRNG